MGRHPSNGGPTFRFTQAEVNQMETILRNHEGQVPPRDFLAALADNFSKSQEREGNTTVQMKQVWSWFQNRRYALRAKSGETPGRPTSSSVTPVTRDTPVRNVPSVPQQTAGSSGRQVVGNTSETLILEYEAKSARDGAWYDVHAFLNLRNLETSDPEVLVRFAGFGEEDDEWINILKNVRPRSLPCEASECIVVNPGDLVLCFQEGKEQALYYDAHVLDAQRRRHDVRGCRCRFLVRYDHDQSEEIVPLRKICRRPETDSRLRQLQAENEAAASSSSVPVVPSNSVAARATVSPSPAASGGPSVLRPAATQVPTTAPTFVQAPTTFRFGSLPPTTVMTSSGTAVTPVFTAPLPVSVPFPVTVAALPAKVSPATVTVSAPVSAPLPVSEPKNVAVYPPISGANAVVVTETPASVPEQKKGENDNPTQILGTSQKKIESDTASPVLPVPQANKAENVDPTPVAVSAPGPSMVETFVPVTVPATYKIETDNPASELTDADSADPAPISVPELIKCDNLVSLPEPNKVETDIPAPASTKDESDIPISVAEPNNAETSAAPNAEAHPDTETISTASGDVDPTAN